MAVNEVLLVSEEKLKAFTSINENVSPQLLIPYVLNAQNTYLVNLIGSTFLRQLYDQVRTNTVSVANRYLLDEYVGNVVLNYALAMAMPFLKYKIFNKSILSPKSETADSIELEELKYLVAQVMNTSQQYAVLLQKYLYYHQNDYPAWTNYNALDGVIPDRASPYQAPLVTNHYPYAWRKRLYQQNARGQYGYTLNAGYDGTQQGVLCDFPWWLWGY
jgi:hypothetical protein